MKLIISTIIFTIITIQVNATNTWIQRLGGNYDGPYNNTDSITGVRDIQICADGNLLVLGYVSMTLTQYLFKITPNGSQIIWYAPVGYHGGMTGSYTRNIYPTPDSGCVISYNDWSESMSFSTYGAIQKFNKNGVLQWYHQFAPHTQGTGPYYDKAIHDVIQNASGNYYATVGDGFNDTLYEFGSTGNILFETDQIKGSKICELQNGDLLVQTFTDTLERRDTTGITYWSISSLRLLACNDTYAFSISTSGIQKINLSTGNIIWTKSYPFGISNITPTVDGGFLGVSGAIPRADFDIYGILATYGNQLPAVLCKVDSSGDTLWTKSYNFPHYGLSCVKQMPSGNIITGGGFIFTNAEPSFFTRDYAAFLSSLDSLGNGVLSNVSYIWPGNANNNNICGFVDDVLFTAIAMGTFGIRRDTFELDSGLIDFYRGLLSDYAIDWPDTFNNGVNYKNADFTGDGRIDTNDINAYANGYYSYFQPFTIPNWRNSNITDFNSLNPDFRLIPERDTVAPGDTIKLKIVIGSSSVMVDSIYGLAFSTFLDWQLIPDTVDVVFRNSLLGTIGSNLLTCDYFNSGLNSLCAMACRTNQLNIYNVYDTIGTVLFTSYDTISSLQTLNVQINEFKALTFSQFEIPFNLLGTTVVIDPTLLKISEDKKLRIAIYPNPASDILHINLPSKSKTKILLLNFIGAELECFNAEGSTTINVKNYPEGIYFLKTISNQGANVITLVIQH